MAFIVISTALNLNEKLLRNQKAKHPVHSTCFNAQDKRKPGPPRTCPKSTTLPERSSANAQRIKKKGKATRT